MRVLILGDGHLVDTEPGPGPLDELGQLPLGELPEHILPGDRWRPAAADRSA